MASDLLHPSIMQPMKHSIYLILISGFLLAACHKSGTEKPANTIIALPSDVPGSAFRLDSFPMPNGVQWTYRVVHQTTTQTNTTTTSSAVTVSATDTVYRVISAGPDTVVNGFRFVRLKGDGSGPLSFLTYGDDYCYYTNTPGGLHRFSDLVHTDSATVQDNMGLIMKLPTSYGSAWSTSNGVRQWWGGYVMVATPAGTYNTVKLKYSYTLGSDSYFSADQYYSGDGLIAEIQYLTTITSTGTGTHETKVDITIYSLTDVVW